MGLFTNPLSYAGYPPNVTGTPTTQNTTVRAATASEAAAGTLTSVYISPATQESATALDFASPPVLGFGSTTPRPVHATTLDSTGTTSLATGGTATTAEILNSVPSGATDRTLSIINAVSGRNDTVNVMTGANTGNAHIFNVLTGAIVAGTSRIDMYTGAIAGGTHQFNLFTNAAAGTLTINMGTCTKNVTMNLLTDATAVHVLNICGAASTLGFFGATAVVKQTQGAITNSVTAGGVTGTIANFTDLTVYANDAATIRNDIYQLALGLQGCIAALRNYGLLA